MGLGPTRTLLWEVLLVLLVSSWSHCMSLSKRQASEFLSRPRRAYQVFEETKQGHLERECVEERCSKEEAREVFENQAETDYFYPRYLVCMEKFGDSEKKKHDLVTCVHNIPDQCSSSPCHPSGSVRCEDQKGDFLCHCFTGWSGVSCDQDVDECAEEGGGCEQECSNTLGTYRCSCHHGYQLVDRHACRDVDECELPGVCGTAQCVNTQGGYHCVCDGGYEFNNQSLSCMDVDECVQGVCEEFCLNTPGSFRCFCDGRQGRKLSQDLRTCKSITPCLSPVLKRNSRSLYLGRMFSAVPVVRLRFRRRVQTGFSAEFDLRTYDPEGVIFFAGGHQNSSWIVLAMHRGKLELQLKYAAVSRVTSTGPLVNDGRWRKISVEEHGRSLVVKIDREAVMKIAMYGDLFTLRKGIHELNLTVGGVPFREDGLLSQVNPRLDGCMRDWRWLSGDDSSIQETLGSNHNMQCFTSEQQGSYYPGSGSALFNISYDYQNLSVDLSVRPTSGMGVLFSIVHQDTVRFSVSLADYHPAMDAWRDFILVSAGNTVVASAPAMLCDGEGHMIRVVVTGNQTLLWVDGQPGRSEETHDPVDLQAPSSTFIGGLPDVPLVSTPVTASYSGCLEVQVNGELLDLDRAVQKHNDIRSHSCPLLDSHQ